MGSTLNSMAHLCTLIHVSLNTTGGSFGKVAYAMAIAFLSMKIACLPMVRMRFAKNLAHKRYRIGFITPVFQGLTQRVHLTLRQKNGKA